MAHTYSAACGPTWMPARDMLSPKKERSEHQVNAFLNSKRARKRAQTIYPRGGVQGKLDDRSTSTSYVDDDETTRQRSSLDDPTESKERSYGV